MITGERATADDRMRGDEVRGEDPTPGPLEAGPGDGRVQTGLGDGRAHRVARRHDAERLARAALLRLTEPGDGTAASLVEALGPEAALAAMTGRHVLTGEEQEQAAAASEAPTTWGRRFSSGLRRWRVRAEHLDPAADLIRMHGLGGGLLIPEDGAWPHQVDDLGIERPFGLWYRGAMHPPGPETTLAAVGSREATAYGRLVTERLVGHAAQAGLTVVSGGAYGIDGIAHRAALDQGTGRPPTIAVLAGGLDRFYPAGHRELLGEIADTGLVVSEMPPGASPTRHRFLYRNRLIAALASAVIVLEARWRSGAQSTAHHALRLGREVGAVPGPVTSAASAGCHRLLLETPARLVIDPPTLQELLPGDPSIATGSPSSLPGTGMGCVDPHAPAARDAAAASALDDLDELTSRTYEALSVRTYADVDAVAVGAGLAVPHVLTGLQRLARRGLAVQRDHQWRAVTVRRAS